MSKYALFIFNKVEEVEALFPLDLLRRAKINVDLISLDEKIVTGSHNIKIISEYLISDVNLDEYFGYIMPGGPGFSAYSKNENLVLKMKEFIKSDKLIAAICASPSFLAKEGIIKKYESTVFKGLENILLENEVKYVNSNLVKDKNLITARSVAHAKDFGLEIIKYILGNEKFLEIKEEIIY